MSRCTRCGKKHPFLKVDPDKICLGCYKEELKRVRAVTSELNALTPELSKQMRWLNQQLTLLRQDLECQQRTSEGEGVTVEYDTRLGEAVNIATEVEEISVSMLQRRMRIGYARAGRLIDEMERCGIVSEADGAKPRKVLIPR